MSRPLISVVMPVWNGEKYLREAINSILGQTFAGFELIVIDDGSDDSTPDILRSFDDPRLKILRRQRGGIVVALNLGIEQAQAEWIARQDADDVSAPDRLESQWRAVNRNPNAVLCHTDFDFISEKRPAPPRARFPSSHALVALKLCFLCPIVHSSVMFRKSVFSKVGGYRPEERHAEDYSLWTRMIEEGEFIGIPKQLVKLRIHQESVSRQNEAIQMRLTEEIALRYCAQLLNVDRNDARRVHETLGCARNRDFSDWIWFLRCCLPRLRHRDVEMSIWVISQTLRRLLAGLTKSKRAALRDEIRQQPGDDD